MRIEIIEEFEEIELWVEYLFFVFINSGNIYIEFYCVGVYIYVVVKIEFLCCKMVFGILYLLIIICYSIVYVFVLSYLIISC